MQAMAMYTAPSYGPLIALARLLAAVFYGSGLQGPYSALRACVYERIKIGPDIEEEGG